MIELEKFKVIELRISCDELEFYCTECKKYVKESGTENLLKLLVEFSEHIDSH